MTHTAVKFNIELFAEYIKVSKIASEEDEMIISIKSFQSKMVCFFNHQDLETVFKEIIEEIVTKMDEFQEKDSGWSLIRLSHIELNINEYHPLRGSQYLKLPKWIAKKKLA